MILTDALFIYNVDQYQEILFCIDINECTVVILKVQFGAPGCHSDVSVHVRCAEPDRLYPRSHAYVAVAFKVLFPCKPPEEKMNPFSGGKRRPQSVETKHIWL